MDAEENLHDAMQQFLCAQAHLLGPDVTFSQSTAQRWVTVTGFDLLVNATKLGNYNDMTTAWRHASVKNEILQLWLREHSARPFLRSQSIEELPYLTRRPDEVQTVGKHGMKAAFAKLLTMFKVSLLIPRIPFKGYTLETFRADLLAGISTGINMTPKGLAFAQLAQVPGNYGLYSSIYPGIVYTFFGSSHHLGVAPSAMMCILTAAVATGWCQNPAVFPEPDQTDSTDIGNCSAEEYNLVVRRIALVQGCALLALGLMKGAFVLRFFSEPLMSGFLTAASLIIILYQMSYFFFNHASHFVNTYDQSMFVGVVNLVSQLDRIHPPTVIFSFVFLIFLILLARNHRTHNLYALIIVVVSTLLAWLLDKYSDFDLYLTGMVDNSLMAPTYDHLRASRNQASVGEWMSQCGAMALVGFLESSCAAQIYAQKFDYVVDINQDLVGVGLANIVGSFFFCIPTMGSVSATAMIATFGGRTGMSNFVSAVTVLVITATLLPALQTLPRAALALIVASAVCGLVNLKIVRFLYDGHRRDLWVLLGLFLMTLILGIQQGLILAILLNGASHVYRSGNTEIYTLGRVVGTPFFQNVKKGKPVYEYKGIKILRFNGALFFGNAAKFKQVVLTDFLRDPNVSETSLILDLSPVNFIDASGVHVLEEVAREFSNRRKLLLLTGINIKTWYKMWVCGLVDQVGRDHFFDTVEQAIARLREAQLDRRNSRLDDGKETDLLTDSLAANVFDWFSQFDDKASRLPVVLSEELSSMGQVPVEVQTISQERKLKKEASERCTYAVAFPYSDVEALPIEEEEETAVSHSRCWSWCPCAHRTNESTPLLRAAPSPPVIPRSGGININYGSSSSTRANAKFELTSQPSQLKKGSPTPTMPTTPTGQTTSSSGSQSSGSVTTTCGVSKSDRQLAATPPTVVESASSIPEPAITTATPATTAPATPPAAPATVIATVTATAATTTATTATTTAPATATTSAPAAIATATTTASATSTTTAPSSTVDPVTTLTPVPANSTTTTTPASPSPSTSTTSTASPATTTKLNLFF